MLLFFSQLKKLNCLLSKWCFCDDWTNRITVYRNDFCWDTTTKQKWKQWVPDWLNSMNVWTWRNWSVIMAMLMPLFAVLFYAYWLLLQHFVLARLCDCIGDSGIGTCRLLCERYPLAFLSDHFFFEKIKRAISEAKGLLPSVFHAPNTVLNSCNITLCSKLEFPCCLWSYPLFHKDIQCKK